MAELTQLFPLDIFTAVTLMGKQVWQNVAYCRQTEIKRHRLILSCLSVHMQLVYFILFYPKTLQVLALDGWLGLTAL